MYTTSNHIKYTLTNGYAAFTSYRGNIRGVRVGTRQCVLVQVCALLPMCIHCLYTGNTSEKVYTVRKN